MWAWVRRATLVFGLALAFQQGAWGQLNNAFRLRNVIIDAALPSCLADGSWYLNLQTIGGVKTWTCKHAVSGGVTSVGLTLPTEFTVAGSPVTAADTLAATWKSAAANLVLATPNGASGIPSLRSLATADLPATVVQGAAGLTTAGAVVCVSGAGAAGECDSAKIFWDNTNKRLGLGVAAGLTHTLHVSGTSRTGGATAYTEFEADGTLVMQGDATVWEDMRLSGSQVRVGNTAPVLTQFLSSGNLRTYFFQATKTQEIEFEIQMPHSWKEGTRIYPHVHWAPTSSATGNVVWQLEYSWANINATFGATTTMATDATAAGGVAWVHKLSAFKLAGNDYIDGTGKTLSSMLVCRMFRAAGQGSDTLAADTAFLEFDFHFEMDTLGSRQTIVK